MNIMILQYNINNSSNVHTHQTGRRASRYAYLYYTYMAVRVKRILLFIYVQIVKIRLSAQTTRRVKRTVYESDII